MTRKDNDQEGYILPYILITSVLIATLILGIISSIYFNNVIELRKLNKKKLELACFSAMQAYISEVQSLADTSYIQSINDIEVNVKTELNGFYYEIITSAKNRDSVKIQYTLADKLKTPFNNAIVISRPNLNAAFAGRTTITGNILASTNLFKNGVIFGTKNEISFNGIVNVDKEIKLKLQLDTLIFLNRLKRSEIAEGEYFDSFTLDEKNIGNIPQPFYANVQGDLIIGGNINLKNNNLTFSVNGLTKLKGNISGNIKVYSDSTIIISEDSNINHLYLYADNDIIIEKGCRLEDVQIFSEQNITISNSNILYPSIIGIYVNASKHENLKNTLEIKSSIINGTTFLVSSAAGLSNNRSKILVDENSKIQGLIYSENNVEILGKVYGTIYTYNFWFYKSPTVYLNWLYNLEVNRPKLDKWFLLPLGFSQTHNLEILKETRIY